MTNNNFSKSIKNANFFEQISNDSNHGMVPQKCNNIKINTKFNNLHKNLKICNKRIPKKYQSYKRLKFIDFDCTNRNASNLESIKEIAESPLISQNKKFKFQNAEKDKKEDFLFSITSKEILSPIRKTQNIKNLKIIQKYLKSKFKTEKVQFKKSNNSKFKNIKINEKININKANYKNIDSIKKFNTKFLIPKRKLELPTINPNINEKEKLNDLSSNADTGKIRLMTLISTFRNPSLLSPKVQLEEELKQNSENISIQNQTIENKGRDNALDFINKKKKTGSNKNKNSSNLSRQFLKNIQHEKIQNFSQLNISDPPILEKSNTNINIFNPLSWEEIHDKIFCISRKKANLTTLRESETLKKKKYKVIPTTKTEIQNEIKYLMFSRPDTLNPKINLNSFEIFGKKITKSPFVFHKGH